MNRFISSALLMCVFTFVSCNTAETAATGTATTVGNAVRGVGRTAATAGTGVAKTVGNTVTTAGTGIAERDFKKATVGTAVAAGEGTVKTAGSTARSHMKTSSGVIKDTGATVEKTSKAAAQE